MKILITDKLEQEGVDVLKAVEEFNVLCKYNLTLDQLKKEIRDCDALIVRSKTHVSAEVISGANNLKCIARAGVGLDNIDVDAATDKGIIVLNAPSGNTTATAEHTMSLMLALSRHIPQSHNSLREGKWERKQFKGVELNGKVLGIVGLGRIGLTVAKMCKVFGMKIIGFDPKISDEMAKECDVNNVSFEALLKTADFITIHVPKTEETLNLIGKNELSLMKSTVRLINCARGGIVNEMDLVEALNTKKIAGAAVDVYEQEPPDFTNPLFKCDNCITTPHIGAATLEAKVNVAVEIAEAVRNTLLEDMNTTTG